MRRQKLQVIRPEVMKKKNADESRATVKQEMTAKIEANKVPHKKEVTREGVGVDLIHHTNYTGPMKFGPPT